MSDEEEPSKIAGMTGPRRAAALLLTSTQTAAAVMRNLSDQEVGAITEEMSRMGTITGEEMELLSRHIASMRVGNQAGRAIAPGIARKSPGA